MPQRISSKRNIEVSVTIRNLTIFGIIIIIASCHCCFPSHFLEHLQIRKVKLHDVRLHYGSNKQNFSHTLSILYRNNIPQL